MEKTELTGGRRDRRLIVLSHLLVEERRDHFFRGAQARQIHVKVVDKEKHDAAAIERNGTFQVDGRGAASGGELRFFVTTGGDFLESLNRPRLSVDTQFEIVFG